VPYMSDDYVRDTITSEYNDSSDVMMPGGNNQIASMLDTLNA